jgi:hypothetical protein
MAGIVGTANHGHHHSGVSTEEKAFEASKVATAK